MNIHQTIYETLEFPAEKVMELIGAGDIASVYGRREQMETFLSEHAWDLDEFKTYLRGSKPLPSKAQMLKNAAGAVVGAALSRVKRVSEEEQQRRHNICRSSCPKHYRQEDDRCSLCGCFTSFKSRLEAWHCPDKRW